MLFIVIHQVYELWFKQVLHEVDHVIALLEARDPYRAQHSMKRILTILKVLVAQLDILETMTPLEFQSFRTRLEAASGFQSDQFRQLEFVLGNKSKTAIERFPSASRARRALEQRYGSPTLWDAFLKYLSREGYSIPGGVAIARHHRAHRAVGGFAVDADRSVPPRPQARGNVRAPRRSRRRAAGVALSSRQDGAAHDRRQSRDRRLRRRPVSGDDADDADFSGYLGDSLQTVGSGFRVPGSQLGSVRVRRKLQSTPLVESQFLATRLRSPSAFHSRI